MSHVTHKYESCHTYTTPPLMSHVTQKYESCHTHMTPSCHTYMTLYESCHTNMTLPLMSHVTHKAQGIIIQMCDTHVCVTNVRHVCVCDKRVTCVRGSCHGPCVWHDSFLWVMSHMEWVVSHVWKSHVTREARGNMTQILQLDTNTWRMRMRHVTQMLDISIQDMYYGLIVWYDSLSWVMSRMEWVMSHMWMSHVTHKACGNINHLLWWFGSGRKRSWGEGTGGGGIDNVPHACASSMSKGRLDI